MIRIKLISALLFSCILTIFSQHSPSENNLALGKPYTLNPRPNYPLSAQSTDSNSLTDGLYTKGFFWTQKTTVGWNNVATVEILIDLENTDTIDCISISTARGIHSGVFYPTHILAFAGPDKKHMIYIGDVVNTIDNEAGEYQTKRFFLNNIHCVGRFVLLEIITNKGENVFCDEIEVIKGEIENRKNGNLIVEDARNMVKKYNFLDKTKRVFINLINKLLSYKKIQPTLRNDIEKYKKSIDTMSNIEYVQLIEAQIYSYRQLLLSDLYSGKELIITEANPWDSFSLADIPLGRSVKQLSCSILKKGMCYFVIVLTNQFPTSCNISLSNMKVKKDPLIINLHSIPYVKALTISGEGNYIADPLIPINGPIPILAGESKVIFISVYGEKPGVWRSAIKIERDKNKIQNIPINIRVLKNQLPFQLSLNSVNWGYLDFDLIKNSRLFVVNDLFEHHTNVLTVPHQYLTGTNQAQPIDLSRLVSYLKLQKGINKIMLDFGFGDSQKKTISGRNPFMGSIWKNNFKNIYQEVINKISETGYNEEQIYIFLYDEIEGEQVEDFMKFASWAKNEIPRIKFYGTISDLKSLKTVQLLTIAQINNDDSLIKMCKKIETELWIYSTKGNTKSLSPYSYYRLMAWKAFSLNIKGIGFWCYADGDTNEFSIKGWNLSFGNAHDYSVVYRGEKNTILSSRRWEAWRMGIEDYELLAMYSKLKGPEAAKSFAKNVLDNPMDVTKADEVRNKILIELSN